MARYLGPVEDIFAKAGVYYKGGKVKFLESCRKEDKTTLYFRVNGYSVRYDVEKLQERVYSRKFSCTCQHNSLTGRICPHTVAAEVWMTISMTYKGWRVK